MKDIRICPICTKETERTNMLYTKDCHGIIYRLVCHRCYRSLMAKGYDGIYYSDEDECLDDDY